MKMPYLRLKTIKLDASLQNLSVTRKFEMGLEARIDLCQFLTCVFEFSSRGFAKTLLRPF